MSMTCINIVTLMDMSYACKCMTTAILKNMPLSNYNIYMSSSNLNHSLLSVPFIYLTFIRCISKLNNDAEYKINYVYRSSEHQHLY